LAIATADLEGFPALDVVAAISITGIPGNLEPSLRVGRGNGRKWQASTIVDKVTVFIKSNVRGVFARGIHILSTGREITRLLD
jgi:hypothetical protein